MGILQATKLVNLDNNPDAHSEGFSSLGSAITFMPSTNFRMRMITANALSSWLNMVIVHLNIQLPQFVCGVHSNLSSGL